jgi:hypothetical protein
LKKEATVDGLASILEENEFKISGFMAVHSGLSGAVHLSV